MKKPVYLVLLFLASVISETAFAQRKVADLYYALDQNFHLIEDLKNSTYLLRVKKFNDSSWRHDIYHLMGPLLQSTYCKDQDGTLKNGKMYLYFENGLLKEQRNYAEGLPEGDFFLYNDTGKIIMKKVYEKGLLTKTIDYLDSVQKKNSPLFKDTTEKEASFKGGTTAWGKYLSSNFEYPKRAMTNNIEGRVTVQFIVNTEGIVEETHLYKSVELSMDDEAIRLINKAPKWIPAVQMGRIVKSYFRQPIICRLN